MTDMLQQTLSNTYKFEGKGLHTGKWATMTIAPAPVDTGIVFRRMDLPGTPCIEAVAAHVSNTARSTTISKDGVSVSTIEHVMSALTGMGIDNAFVEIEGEEVPILDGSARYYAEAFSSDALVRQGQPRRLVELPEEVSVEDEKTGAWVRISPSSTFSYDVTTDFGSRVLGVQTARWDAGVDYAREIAVCRTFVFFHEIEYLFANNLIKGGDVDNAIVIVEHPVSRETLDRMSSLFGHPSLEVTGQGYLNNLQLHFNNECGRHKLLDLIGDLRLAGGFLSARVTAYKPGHRLNTLAAKAVAEVLEKNTIKV